MISTLLTKISVQYFQVTLLLQNTTLQKTMSLDLLLGDRIYVLSFSNFYTYVLIIIS